MIELNKLKENDTIWKVHKDSTINKYIKIRYIKRYDSEDYLSFTYGNESSYDIDYGYPYSHFNKEDEIDLFYTKEDALKEIENRKDDLSNEL